MATSNKARVAYLASGSGSTVESNSKACFRGDIPADPVVVIANNGSAGVLKRAEDLEIPTRLFRFYRDFRGDEDAYGDAILRTLAEFNVDFVGQLGWMLLTPRKVVEAYLGRIWNQHPGPLDPSSHADFGGQGMHGKRVHHARMLYCRWFELPEEEHWTEATSQLVSPEYDRGDLLLTRRVPILPTDEVENLQERVLPVEHHVQIETLRGLIDGTITPFQREDRLVPDDRAEILTNIKKIAVLMHP